MNNLQGYKFTENEKDENCLKLKHELIIIAKKDEGIFTFEEI